MHPAFPPRLRHPSFLPVLSLALLLALGGCSQPDSPATPASPPDSSAVMDATERARLEARAERVTIIRDDFGVPHIYGKTDADVVFGLLFAQAEDDFPRVERNYVWAIGRLAEVQGESALYSDLRARLYMTREEAEAAYAAAPDWLRQLCDAFADGLNWYLATHPDVQPELLTRFEPWMPFYFFEGSIGGDIEQIPVDGIEAFYSRGRSVVDELPRLERPAASGPAEQTAARAAAQPAPVFVEPSGSNGFAIAGSRTASGNAMLLINPHTSFFFRGEVHLVSEEGLNAYGAVTWGQFFVYQGFNEDTGWMHTSTYADFIDEFVEEIVRDEDTLLYRYGDELRPVTVGETTLAVRDGDALRERSFPLYRTHHGPITHRLDGNWVATRINWDPVNALRQSYLRMKNADHDAFRAMMDIRTNSSNNTVYADSSGNIAYYHGNFMPRRNPGFDFSEPVDGSDPATDWQGLHTVDETVHLLNPPNGWIQNTNSTPFSAAGEHSPKREDYPVYMAPDDQNFRAVHAVQVLDDIDDLTLDGLIALAHDPYLPGLEALVTGLVEAWAEAGSPSTLAEPIAVLRDWDLRVRADSVAMSLAHFYGVAMIESELATPPEGLNAMDRIDWLGRSSPVDLRLRTFADTVARLQGDFGDWRTPWSEINRYQRLDGAIEAHFDDDAPSTPVPMASGNWGALASFGAPIREDTKRIYGRYGNSFVAAVEFGERVRAKSILAGGQSSHAQSPHFDDQVQRYLAADFKDVAFYREDVERRAQRTYHPGL